jgi:molecular chaperone IbpA
MFGAGIGGRPMRCSYPCCSTEDVAMRNYDFSTFSRSSVGFEPLFNLMNEAQKRFNEESGFPPYDIVRRDESAYLIRLAVAGFSPDELIITAQQNLLTVVGQKKNDEKRQYLHEGIDARGFERQFSLADHVEVKSALCKDGILEIEQHQEIPEAAKPRRIAINGGSSARLVN